MKIKLTRDAENDFTYWRKSGNKAIQKKIETLLKAIIKDPFSGIGKPELLKHDYQKKWSRRIDKEHRIVYEVKEQIIYISSLKGHY